MLCSTSAPVMLAYLLYGSAQSQNFEHLVVGLNYPNLTSTCLQSLNTTVANCPELLLGVSVDNERLDTEQLGALCTAECQTGLQNARKVIASGCNAPTDIMEIDGIVWPATYIIDRYLYTYNLACRKDAASGQYCDEIFFSWLNDSSTSTNITAQNCSDCMIGSMEAQLNSPFGYDEEFAEDFENLTASCGVAGYSYTSPAPYSITTIGSADPNLTDFTCSSPYIVKVGDSCYSIATTLGVSTNSIITAGRLDPSCGNLIAGAMLCLPGPCDLYEVQYDDTCASIVSTYSNITAYQLLLWNPNVNALCTNMRTMVGSFLCIRYTIQAGDYCEAISIRLSISLKDFYFLNPSIDTDCTNLLLGIAYCVEAVGSISTYPGYPTTTALYTLTASAYVTTTNVFSTTIASVTPVATLALATGTETDCVDYVEYVPVPGVTDQTNLADASVLTTNINSCDYATTYHGISLQDFISWNPSLASLGTCELQAGYRYCALNNTSFTPEIVPDNNCLNVTAYAGTISSCSCFTEIDGSSVGSYPCSDLALDASISVANLQLWNPWIGPDCDAGLYAGLDTNSSRAVCIADGNGTAGPTNTTTTTVATNTNAVAATTASTASVGVPPGPTQTGIATGCTAYHTAVEGDGCWSIAKGCGITMDQFYAWNPAVSNGCANLWLGYSYCVAAGGPTPRPGTP
ncbi:carbohydrate-binding module family 50 protein [Hypoxylon sp. FL1284]|nr:carbohydrate-binding module family 50 protein [Hypoxylon sp. FL1284]